MTVDSLYQASRGTRTQACVFKRDRSWARSLVGEILIFLFVPSINKEKHDFYMPLLDLLYAGYHVKLYKWCNIYISLNLYI